MLQPFSLGQLIFFQNGKHVLPVSLILTLPLKFSLYVLGLIRFAESLKGVAFFTSAMFSLATPAVLLFTASFV